MAKYLWVGGAGSTGATLTGTQLVDQYCFNKSGNWYIQQIVNGTLKWASSSAVPGNGDSVVFGMDFSNNSGWTAAKSPCLYGGFSGGVGAGVWTMTGPTATSGTTYTSPLNSITVHGLTFGYLFPYLGGGISGDIATWCALRDSVGATYYSVDNSTGFRDPSQNLRLKWSGDGIINLPSVILSTSAAGVTSAGYDTYLTKFVMDFDTVKATTPLSGGTAGSAGTGSNPIVSTQLKFNAGYGAGLRVRGGSFKTISINTSVYPSNSIFANPYSYISDNGIELYNAYIDTLTVTKAQSTYVSGCTASVINVYPFAWKTNSSTSTYAEQVDLEISSNISAISTYTDLYGLTLSVDIPASANAINLPFSPMYLGGSAFDVVSNPNQTSNTKQVVIFGDRIGTKTCSVPTINISSATSVGATGIGGYAYMPWAVEFAGSVNCNLINNNAGYIYSNADIQQSSTVSVSELKLSNYATLDFAKNSSVFDDWRFGGLTASGTQIAGGIVFTDETAKVLGSEGLRLWNTQTKGGGVINARITDTKSYSIPTVAI